MRNCKNDMQFPAHFVILPSAATSRVDNISSPADSRNGKNKLPKGKKIYERGNYFEA